MQGFLDEAAKDWYPSTPISEVSWLLGMLLRESRRGYVLHRTLQLRLGLDATLPTRILGFVGAAYDPSRATGQLRLSDELIWPSVLGAPFEELLKRVSKYARILGGEPFEVMLKRLEGEPQPRLPTLPPPAPPMSGREPSALRPDGGAIQPPVVQ